MLADLYPASPENVPADLGRPTSRYRVQVAIAVVGVTVFLGLYFGLAGWLTRAAFRGLRGDMGPRGVFVAIPAAFVALVLLKSLVALKRRRLDGLVEVTAESEPRLVAFVHRVADEVGAKRPKRIYLSESVNASVFFDVGFWNLLVPTKKNLELGLGLINVLSLDELKAVVAHEFGHFAQRSMGVGSWVYIAQSLVGDLISRRDILDRGLDVLSRVDIRIAWVGWAMRLLVWSLRALVEHAFRVLLRINRALSQQMEFQADLVSVRAAGSDSLVHALHRLRAADESFQKAAMFALDRVDQGKSVPDLLAIQTRIMQRHREVYDQPDFGASPVRPEHDAAASRVFRPGLGEAPRMWSTHPPNHEREANCKAQYIPSTLDPRSAWELFDHPEQLRADVTAAFVARVRDPRATTPLTPGTTDELLEEVDRFYGRPHLQRCYQGLYTVGTLTRMRRSAGELVAPCAATGDALRDALRRLYPDTLVQTIDTMEEFGSEKSSLEALKDGFLEAPGGLIVHRGRQLRRRELPATIAEVTSEWELLRETVLVEFMKARGVHLAIAREVRPDAEAYLTGLLELLRYAEHARAEVDDAMSHFDHVMHIVLADGHVSKAEMRRLCGAGEILADVVARLYRERLEVEVPHPVLTLMKLESWAGAMPEHLGLYAPDQAALADNWIPAAHSWADMLSGLFGSLALRTLDSLLETEAYLADCLRTGSPCDEPPPPARTPAHAAPFAFGSELPRQKRLDLWDRFQVADGPFASAMRLGVASAVFAPALLLTAQPGEADVVVRNGLERTVEVQLGAHHVRVQPHEHVRLEVEFGSVPVEARTDEGAVIEHFDQELDRGTGAYVYNVAQADTLYRYTAVYGLVPERPPEFLSSPRFEHMDADFVLQTPPTRVSTGRSSSGTTRSVVAAFPDDADPWVRLEHTSAADRQALVEAHLRWDPADARWLGIWAEAHSDPEQRARLLAQRVAESPADLRLKRLAIDAPGSGLSCEDVAQQASTQPDDADLLYLDLRCREPGPERAAEWVAAHERFPRHPFLAWGAAYVYALRQDAEGTMRTVDTALSTLSRFAEMGAPVLAARMLRLVHSEEALGMVDALRHASPELDRLLLVEAGGVPEDSTPLTEALQLMAQGNYASALARNDLQPPQRAWLTLLVAASVDAPPDVTATALTEALGDAVSNPFVALGVALREAADPAPYLSQAQTRATDGELLARFDLAAIRVDPAALDTLIADSDLNDAMHLRLVAAIALGTNAPPALLDMVERYFFPTERPRFR